MAHHHQISRAAVWTDILESRSNLFCHKLFIHLLMCKYEYAVYSTIFHLHSTLHFDCPCQNLRSPLVFFRFSLTIYFSFFKWLFRVVLRSDWSTWTSICLVILFQNCAQCVVHPFEKLFKYDSSVKSCSMPTKNMIETTYSNVMQTVTTAVTTFWSPNWH